DAGVLGPCQHIRLAEPGLAEAELLEPRHRKARLRVDIPLLLGEVGVQFLVDELQGGADGEPLAVGLQHLAVAAVDGHARPDARLREVHRGDVARLHLLEGGGKLPAERVDEVPAGDDRRVLRARTAHQHDGRGEGVGADAQYSSASLCTYWPRTYDREPGCDKASKHCLPTSACNMVI